jgi:hypothetical protein
MVTYGPARAVAATIGRAEEWELAQLRQFSASYAPARLTEIA